MGTRKRGAEFFFSLPETERKQKQKGEMEGLSYILYFLLQFFDCNLPYFFMDDLYWVQISLRCMNL